MKSASLFLLTIVGHAIAAAVYNSDSDVTYEGVFQKGVETFFAIPYGQDTGGANRFKAPKPFVPAPGSTISAQSRGPVCPQPMGDYAYPLYLSNVTEYSEDCLHLNIYRPKGTSPHDSLPVMLHIHGGSFFEGSKDELVIQPEGLVLRSVEMEHPIMFVTINYRLGVFGFASSEALHMEGSQNAGLKDQRLAIEWARDNIGYFGGNGSQITIAGQSSGGLAMGLQMVAYGGSRGFPFQGVSSESQILEPGITGEFTTNAMKNVANDVECNATDLQSAATIQCLRALSTTQLQRASTRTHHDGPASNIGDQWMPVVDGDFLPARPSQLIYEGRFANVTTMVGWTEGDANPFVPSTLHNDAEVYDFISKYQPSMTPSNVRKLLSLYPVTDFQGNPDLNLTAQVFRCARIVRDIVFTCQPFLFGEALSAAGNDVYLWEQNQTMFDEILPGYGVVHTSNFAYQFHNLSHYNVDGFPFHPNKSDFALADRQSGSWASFTSTGSPSFPGKNTLKGWTPAFKEGGEIDIFVIGGPHEGLSPIDGPGAKKAVADQKLRQRCGFLNSPEIVKQLDY